MSVSVSVSVAASTSASTSASESVSVSVSECVLCVRVCVCVGMCMLFFLRMCLRICSCVRILTHACIEAYTFLLTKTGGKIKRTPAAPVAAHVALEIPPQTSTHTSKKVPAELTALFDSLASPLVGFSMDVNAREWLQHLRGVCSLEHSPCDASTNAFLATPRRKIPHVSAATRSALKPVGEDTEVQSDIEPDSKDEDDASSSAGSDGSSDVQVESIFFLLFS